MKHELKKRIYHSNKNIDSGINNRNGERMTLVSEAAVWLFLLRIKRLPKKKY